LRRLNVFTPPVYARQIRASNRATPLGGSPLKRQVARYGVVGIANTIVGLGCILVGKAVLALPDLTANALGYSVGLLQSYLLNRSWTFGHSQNSWTSLWRFLAVAACGYVVNLCCMLVAIDRLGMNSYLGQLLGMGAYVIFVFFGSRNFAFGLPTQLEKDLR
jgi:putative flippase GtrA